MRKRNLLDKIFGIRWMLDEKHFFPTNRFAAFLLDMAVHQGQLVVDKDINIIPLYRLNK